MITISTRIPEELDKELAALAKATDRTKAYLVRQALEHYIKQAKASGIIGKKSKKHDNLLSLSALDDLKKKPRQ